MAPTVVIRQQAASQSISASLLMPGRRYARAILPVVLWSAICAHAASLVAPAPGPRHRVLTVGLEQAEVAAVVEAAEDATGLQWEPCGVAADACPNWAQPRVAALDGLHLFAADEQEAIVELARRVSEDAQRQANESL